MSEKLNNNGIEVEYYNLADDADMWEYEKTLTSIFRNDYRIIKHQAMSTMVDKNSYTHHVSLIYEIPENAEEVNDNSAGVGFFNIDDDREIDEFALQMQEIEENDWKVHQMKNILVKNEDSTSSLHIWLAWEKFDSEKTECSVGVGFYSLDNETSRKDYKRDLEMITQHEHKIIADTNVVVQKGKFVSENMVLLIWKESKK